MPLISSQHLGQKTFENVNVTYGVHVEGSRNGRGGHVGDELVSRHDACIVDDDVEVHIWRGFDALGLERKK